MGLKVVMDEKEANSEVRKPLPRGVYKATISDVDLKESKSQKHNGKPYYAIEFTINEPAEHEGRKVYSNVMLFAGALYSLNQLLKALGIETAAGQEIEVPEEDELLGQEMLVKLSIKPAESGVDQTGKAFSYDERNEVKGIMPLGADEVKATAGAASSKGSSLLPS